MHSTSAHLPIAVQHQCVRQCRSESVYVFSVPFAGQTESPPQCTSPAGQASAEIGPRSVQGNSLKPVHCASAQKIASNVPGTCTMTKRAEKGPTREPGWRCFLSGRGNRSQDAGGTLSS